MKFLVAFFALCAVAYAGFLPKFDNRIIGGAEVDMEDYPYIVSVRIQDRHVCGGSILDEDTILTAAYCVHDKNPKEFSVRVGEPLYDYGIFHGVSEVRKNKAFDPKTRDNDMAILKLFDKISFTDTVQPILLQPRGTEVTPGTISWVSGWGAISKEPTYEDWLRAVDVAVISNEECSKKYEGKNKITDRMLCAHTPSKDYCYEDFGGPLVADGRLIGVVSSFWDCASPKYPGVYAKVSAMYDWIQDNRY